MLTFIDYATFFVESQYVFQYAKEDVEQNEMKSVPDWVRIEKVLDRCHITGN